MTDEEPHGLFRRKVVEAGGFWQIAWLFFTQGFQMASQSLIRMGISQSFDLAPELLHYEGLPEESQPSKECSLQPRPFGVAAGSYNAALDLSHTALRAESEGERYTGVLYRTTLAFALRV